MTRLAIPVRTFGIGAALALASLSVVPPITASAASTTWHVQVGGGDFTTLTSQNRFYPRDITVHSGDTVEFAWGGFHTVTFNPPAAPVLAFFAPNGATTLDTPTTYINGAPNQGGGPGGPPPAPFDVTIGANLPAGTYHYRCMLHQFMHGTIRVIPADSPLPKTDAEYQAIAHSQMAKDATRAAALDARTTRQNTEVEDGVVTGISDRVVQLLKFYPSSITVRVGEKLTFRSRDLHDPHTVTFGPEPNPSSPIGAIFPSGPGNPNAYDGVAALNSGFLFSDSQADYWHLNLAPQLSGLKQTTTFRVTFTKTGTFNFYCALHGARDPSTGAVFGMSGSITVLPAEGED
jgi:plastocyanin